MRKLLLCLLLLSGCARMQNLVAPYRIDIQQGNAIDAATVAKIQPGMSRAQVIAILGTPLVNDPFHKERMDYYYRLIRAGKPGPAEHLTVFLKGDNVDHIETNVPEAPAAAQ